MINKQKILTFAGIALSLAIAVGGWVLTSMLINMKSDALLSVSGITWINTPVAHPTDTAEQNTGDNTPILYEVSPTITESDIISILQIHESSGQEEPHEPTSDQISMEEAISIGETTLAMFDINGIIPAERFIFDKTKTTAYLAQSTISPHGSNGSFLAPIYSYWMLVFKGDGVDGGSASMRINALTGKILEIDLQFNQYSYPEVYVSLDDAKNILTYFTTDIGITSDADINVQYNDVSSPPSIIAYQEFADGGFYAIANINGRRHPDEHNKIIPIGIHIYLSTDTHRILIRN